MLNFSCTICRRSKVNRWKSFLGCQRLWTGWKSSKSKQQTAILSDNWNVGLILVDSYTFVPRRDTWTLRVIQTNHIQTDACKMELLSYCVVRCPCTVWWKVTVSWRLFRICVVAMQYELGFQWIECTKDQEEFVFFNVLSIPVSNQEIFM